MVCLFVCTAVTCKIDELIPVCVCSGDLVEFVWVFAFISHWLQYIPALNTRSVRKVSDRIFLCEHLMDYNLARLHEPTLNLSAHA
jgi:hypothetical protein